MIVVDIEEKFEVKVPEHMIISGDFKTFNRICRMIQHLLVENWIYSLVGLYFKLKYKITNIEKGGFNMRALGKKTSKPRVSIELRRGCPCITICDTTNQNAVKKKVASWTSV